MIEIGDYNVLLTHEKIDAGMLLIHPESEPDERDLQKILLPNAYVPKELGLNEAIQVFIYLDSEDRIIATNLSPLITVNTISFLQVKEVNTIGVFVDMGLAKDLLIPYNQQATSLTEGKSYLVHMYLDEVTSRLIGSTKINQFLSNDEILVTEGEEVNLLVSNKTNLGFNVVVNKTHLGLVFHSEIFREISTGDKLVGFVRSVRKDNKLDISLSKAGESRTDSDTDLILEYLRNNNNSMTLTDKSSPDEIYKAFNMSKKSFKKALGSLYKSRLVEIVPGKITLI